MRPALRQAICFRQWEPGKERLQGPMPFEALVTRNSAPRGPRARLRDEDVQERLWELREEFEVRGGGDSQGGRPCSLGWALVRGALPALLSRAAAPPLAPQLLRTLADQVRKRERLKKQLAKLYRLQVATQVRRGWRQAWVLPERVA
jgi:hypothetical protein